MIRSVARFAFLTAAMAMLSGCNAVVFSPSGDVAVQQRNILLLTTGVMLIIVIPVMAAIGIFAWRYRESRNEADYAPDWSHSTRLELVIWSIPLLIIICLGAITWASTHLLDPTRPLDRLAAGRSVPRDAKPLRVEVVALDWKWLFIYPEQGFATVNELAAPVDRPLEFHITSSSVMNSFFIPALAGQIYAMPGMETRLKAVINAPGTYDGFSANYSGAGFSGMHFAFKGVSEAEFVSWTEQVQHSAEKLDRLTYLKLERPTENEPVHRYATVDPTLFKAILNMCVDSGRMCMDEMSAIDAKGGLGLANARNLLPFAYDKFARRGAVFANDPSYLASLCEIPVRTNASTFSLPLESPMAVRLTGSGIKPPAFSPFRQPKQPTFELAAPSNS